MFLKTARRAAATALLATAVVVVPSTTPSAALDKEPLTVRVGEVTEMKGGPLAGNVPTSGLADPTPDECGSGDVDNLLAPGTFCDTVPILVEIPADAGAADEFFVRLEITWTPDARNDNEVQDLQANDIDTFIYDDKQVNGTTYYQITLAAGGEQPEAPKWLVGTIREFNLIVLNYSGVNEGYTVRGTLIEAKFESPFESLDPEFNGFGGQGDETSDDVYMPPDYSGDDAGTPAFSGPSFLGPVLTGSSPLLPTIDVIVDDDLDSMGSSTFTQDIQEPQSVLPVGSSTPVIPKKVPAIVLLFWLLVVPAAMVIGGFIVLWRRNRDQFVAPAAA